MKPRGLYLILIFSLVIGGIGLLALNASQYSDVGSLAELDRDLRVTVSGDVVPVGYGEFKLVVAGKEYIVEGRGPFGIAKPVSGDGEEYAVFILKGSNGFKVAALYPAEEFVAKYGLNPVVDTVIVVDGIYRAGLEAYIESGGDMEDIGVLEVLSILKGCHSAYQQPRANLA